MKLTKAYWLLWTGQILNRIGLIAPAFLVIYLQRSGIINESAASLIVGLFGVGIVLAGLLGGVLAESIGPRKLILIAEPIAVLIALLYLVVRDPILIGILALLSGALSTIERPAGAALISTMVSPDHFPRAYGLHLMGFNVGTTLSLVLSGLFLEIFPPGIFMVWAACSALYWGFAKSLPPDETVAKTEPFSLKNMARDLAEPYRQRSLVVFLVLCFIVALIYLQVNSTLPLHMLSEGINSAQIGIVLAVNAVLSIVLLPLVPKLVAKWPDSTPLVLASVFVGVGFGLNAFAHDVPFFLVALIFWTIGEVLWAPMSAGYLAARAPEGRTSSYMSSYFFVWNTAFMIGGPLGIVIANAFGYPALWLGVLVLGLLGGLGFKLLAVPKESHAKTDAKTDA
ncbi:MFS transporter [Arthrobacter russicus]|uniref:MFS family permease n=1 Tax=Arthrobacter russicus TaxID=172040 RepID=A0ABU1J8V5_9MICC|nr:MFS transporter [Arthrobacter russicus]MBQ1445410.1 MFS transporter [Renibacterium sp.]MDN5669019.1 MFS transporter [Renibacterium salmoninarum]MDR6268856.1 MFS family permease [Arthrobacter russicus]